MKETSMKAQLENFAGALENTKAVLEDVQAVIRLPRSRLSKLLVTHADALRSAQATIKKVKYKSYTDILESRDSVKYIASSIADMSVMVAEGKMKKKAFQEAAHKTAASLGSILSVVEAYISIAPTSREEDSVSTKDIRSDVAARKVARMLSRLKAQYSTKIPKKLNHRIQVLELPLMARFENLAVTKDVLEVSGFSVQSAGLHSAPSSDLGFVFDPQPVLLFRLSDAKAYAADRVKRTIESDSVIQRKKALQKERSAERRNLKKLQEMVQTKRIMERITKCEETIQVLTEELDGMSDKLKKVGSAHRAMKATKQADNQAVMDYLMPIVEALSKHSGQPMSIFTTRLMTGIMSDADVMCAWLCTSRQIKAMMRRTDGDMKLKSWFLPWS